MLEDSLPVLPHGEPLYLLIAASFLPLYDNQTILYKVRVVHFLLFPSQFTQEIHFEQSRQSAKAQQHVFECDNNDDNNSNLHITFIPQSLQKHRDSNQQTTSS
jgi:hypothetical protein